MSIDPDQERLRLLRATLQHAVSSTPYYAEAFAGLNPELRTLDEMRAFPLLTREILMARGLDLVAAGVLPEYVRNTSGTTFSTRSRKPLVRFHSEAERDAWLAVTSASASEGTESPLALRLLSLDHGLDLPGAVPGFFALPLEKPAHLPHIVSVLRQEYRFEGYSPRVRLLTGSLTLIKLLTFLCIERGVDPAEFALGLIVSHSQQLTAHARRLLESFWQVEMTEVYGLSEVPGLHAARCAECGHFHFSPLTYVEVLHPSGDAVVRSGIGRVVATGLLPLVQAQPMIRYETEDLIELLDARCSAHVGPAFEFVGRSHDVVLDDRAGGRRLLLGSMQLNELLDGDPHIAITPNPRAGNTGLRHPFGYQKYALRRSEGLAGLHLALELELRWPPAQYPDAAAALAEQTRRRVLASSQALAERVREGSASFEVRLLDPGTTRHVAEA